VASRSSKQGKVRGTQSATRTRSFPCPDDLWAEVEAYAAEQELGAPAAAARLLLRRGLTSERRARELDAARDWQIEQAWVDVEAIAGGAREVVSWSRIEDAADLARRRIRERAHDDGSRSRR
jgi:hypothetical protein